MKDFKYIPELNIPMEIVSYKNSKSVKLYIKDGYIKITKPTWYSKSNIYEYIKKNRDDILKMYNENLEKLQRNSLLNKDYIFLLGEKYILNIEQSNKDKAYISFDDSKCNIVIPYELDAKEKELLVSKLVNIVYRKQSIILVGEALQKYCTKMNISIPNFRVKKCKSIWGSCSSKGNLNFNIKVAMLPSYIIDNIVVHELCHLKHKNHGQDFWNMVYSYCGKDNYIVGEKWIKQNIPFSLDF